MTFKVYNADSYLKLGLNGPWTPPFALENRGPRDRGGKGNYYASRGTQILGIVAHITAGITDLVGEDTSAESTNQYGRTTTVEASWTGLVDSDSIINSLHPDRVAWVQGVSGYNFNRPLVGVEIGKRESNWIGFPQPWVDATLENFAAYCAPIVIRYSIPLRLMTDRNEIQRLIMKGQKVGFTEHWYLTPETRQDAGRVGNRTTFPWERFFTILRARIAKLQGKPVVEVPKTGLEIVKGTKLTVTANVLNTRSGAGTNHDVIGSVPKGTVLTATGKVSGAWIEAQSPYQVKNKQKSWYNSAWVKVKSQPKPAAPKTPAPAPSNYPVLRYGSQGATVKKLQQFAMKTFPAYADSIKSSGGADGSFGRGTEAWVKEFQRRSGLQVDGSVGPKTWTELGKYGMKP